MSIPVYGAYDSFRACLLSVLRHTPADVKILVADDATPGGDIERVIRDVQQQAATEHEVIYFEQPINLGFVGNMNAVFESTAPADVVLLNSDCLVAEGWLTGLRRAACSDGTVATATALTNNGTIVSIPTRNIGQPGLPDGWTLDAAAAAVAASSLRLYPRIPTAVGHCVYMRRSALELVGEFDRSFSPGYGEEVDFSQRCVLRGLCHVVADDVFVLHQGGASFKARPEWSYVQEAHDRLIDARYPYYRRMVDEAAYSTIGPLPRALGIARRSLLGLSVTIEASCLGPQVTGTQVHVLELIRALSVAGGVRLRVAVPINLGEYARRILAGIPGLEMIVWEEVDQGTPRTDVVHRPYQVTNPHELEVLRWLGERTVITQQDLIAFRNPGYFRNGDEWRRYRRVIRESLNGADRIVFFSNHAANEALAEEIADPERSRVVYIGTDHHLRVGDATPVPPAGAAALEGVELMACLGTDFRHKNRLFALRVLEQLQGRHAWKGRLVLAGPRVAGGSSIGEERAFLASRPSVNAAVVNLEGLTEGERVWLLQRTKVVLYPTIQEGFGLVPFEAADAGVPTLFAPQTSLAEVLPVESGLLVPWDPAASADRAIALMRDGDKARAFVETVRGAAKKFRWETTASALLRVYAEAASAAARPYERLDEHDEGRGTLIHTARHGVERSVSLLRTYGAVEGSQRVARGVGRRVRRRLARLKRRKTLPE
ncbi:MAG TPA: glycosyltransferase [Candidatus Dormibacteraeota bacterium]